MFFYKKTQHIRTVETQCIASPPTMKQINFIKIWGGNSNRKIGATIDAMHCVSTNDETNQFIKIWGGNSNRKIGATIDAMHCVSTHKRFEI